VAAVIVFTLHCVSHLHASRFIALPPCATRLLHRTVIVVRWRWGGLTARATSWDRLGETAVAERNFALVVGRWSHLSAPD